MNEGIGTRAGPLFVSVRPRSERKTNMDVRGTFRKIRQVESTIADEFVVIFSLPTVDGGREGVLTQVPRFTAAKSIVEGRARLATAEEAARFHEKATAARKANEENLSRSEE